MLLVMMVILLAFFYTRSGGKSQLPILEAPKSLYQLDREVLDHFEMTITDILVPEFEPVERIVFDNIEKPTDDIIYFDKAYDVLSTEQLFTFIEWWKIFLVKNNLRHRENSFDCDNFSNLFKSILFLTNKYKENSGQILVGLAIVKQKFAFAYIPSGNEVWHMMNIVYTDEGWYMVEPQNGMYIHIDYYPNEILSVYF